MDRRQRELFMAIVWALAVIRGRIETAAARIEGEQIFADLGRNRSRLKHNLDAIVRAIGLIDGSASEFHAQRHDGILPLLPSVAFRDDVDKIKALLEAAAERRFYPALYGTDGHVSEDPEARFNDVFQAGVGDFAAITRRPARRQTQRYSRPARLARPQGNPSSRERERLERD